MFYSINFKGLIIKKIDPCQNSLFLFMHKPDFVNLLKLKLLRKCDKDHSNK